MTLPNSTEPATGSSRSPLRDYWILIRPRIIGLVLFTMIVAALVAGEPPGALELLHALVGSALVIAGAIALNQRIERRTDALMRRTFRRPLPSGRLTPRRVTWFGALTSGAGLGYLALTASPTVLALTAASWVVYVWIYTPIKALSAWQTPLGALAGAMPVLMGAAVADAPWSLVALVLFGIDYLWQFPHAMAIAWIYRDDFAAAQLQVATVVDPSGRSAGVISLVGAVLLLPVSLAPWYDLSRSPWLAVPVVLLGLWYLAASIAFYRAPDDRTARTLLRVSLAYLPLVFGVLWMGARS